MKVRLVLLAAMMLPLLGCGKSAIHFMREGGPVTQAPTVEQTATLRKLWRRDLGAGYQNGNFLLAPSLQTGRLYAAEPGGRIYSLDAESGQIIWQQNLEESLAAGVGADTRHVIVVTREGEVVSLDAENGSLRWRQKMGTEVLARPVLTEKQVLLRSGDGQVIGADLESGGILWRVRRSVPALTVRGLSAPLVINNVALIGFASGRLSGIDVESGAELWSARIFRARGSNEVNRLVDIDSDPYQMGERLIIAGFQAQISAVSLKTRRIEWDADYSTLRPLSAVGDILLVTADDGSVSGLDIQSGTQIWKLDALLGRGVSGPFGLEPRGFAVVGDYKGLLYLLDAASGEFVGRNKVGGGAVLGIYGAGDDDRFVTLSENGSLTAWAVGE